MEKSESGKSCRKGFSPVIVVNIRTALKGFLPCGVALKGFLRKGLLKGVLE